MKKRLRWFVFFLILLSLIPVSLRAQDEASDLLGRVNALRGTLSLPGYRLNGSLSAAAQSQAQWMVDTGNISHTREDGSTPRSRAMAAGYPTTEVSENIYGGTNAGVGDAWTFWINSRIHYAGLTNARYQEIGIGVAHGSWGATYVLVFGNPGGPAYVPPVFAANNSGNGGQPQPPSYVVGLDAHGNIMHEVQPGDTLGDIALIYGYTWADVPYMLQINSLTEADIRDLEIGSVFLVPPKDGTYTPTPGGETPTPILPTATEFLPTIPPPVTPEPSLTPAPTLAAVAATVTPVATLAATLTPVFTTSTDLAGGAADAPSTTGAIMITPDAPSPWLLIALLVQAGVLLAAGIEFVRRARRH